MSVPLGWRAVPRAVSTKMAGLTASVGSATRWMMIEKPVLLVSLRLLHL